MTNNVTIFNGASRLDIIFQEENIREIEIELDGSKTQLATFDEAEEAIVKLVDDFETKTFKHIKIYANDTSAVFTIIKNCYADFIIAAGGLVVNELDQLLVIHRNGMWDLPKGKVEPGEAITDAAVREVEEETGLQNIELKDLIVKTYHTYTMNGKTVLKETHWYDMLAPKQALRPQQEENITEAKWLPKADLPEILKHTYDNIKLVFVQS